MKTNLGEALLAHCRNRLPPDAFLYVEPDSQIAVRDFVALAQGAGRFWQDRLRPGERVVIAKPDSIDHIACFCGVLLAGGVPVSVNPALKPTALAALIADCGALHLVAEPGVAAEAPRPPGLNVWDASRQSPRGQPNVLDPALRTGEVYPVLRDDTDLAVLQYSSGTTGAPKGIMQSARGILSYCETFARQHLQLHPGDLTYSVARVHFAFGAGNSVFFPLYCGCPTFLDPRRPTLEVVLDNLALVRPTAFFAVPTVFRWILAADVAPRAADVLRELRIAGSAGLPLSADLFERFRERFHCSIVDILGATEMGHAYMANCIRPDRSTLHPLPGYRIELAQTDHVPLTEGGEMLVSGPSLSLGYYQSPGRTAEKFRAGWYHTGDLFAREPEGGYVYLGRTDDTFKVKGKWVVPEPLEQQIVADFSEVLDAVIVGIEMGGEPASVLFVQLVDAATPFEPLQLRLADYCYDHWESHERPVGILRVDTMPQNSNGKRVRAPLKERWQAGNVAPVATP